MPYIVTTSRKYHPLAADSPENVHHTRHAVATLDEMNAAVRDACTIDGHKHWKAPEIYNRCLDDGGTVGPLPDGTVIEVEHVSNSALGYCAGLLTVDHPQLWRVEDLVKRANDPQHGLNAR